MKNATLALEGYRFQTRFFASKLPPERRVYAPVVILGGAFQTMEALAGFARAFAERTDVVLVDPPGSGASDPLPARYGADYLARCVELALEHWSVGSASVIGVSFGTAIALRVAERRPESTPGLVLIGTMSHVDERMEAGLVDCVRALSSDDVAAFAERMCGVLLNAERRDGIENFALVERILRRTAARMTPLDIAHFRANADRLRLHRRLQNGAAPAVRTLVFTGEHDCITTPNRCRAVADRFRDAECFVVRNADHLVPLERPRECLELVDAFLRGLRVKRAREVRRLAG